MEAQVCPKSCQNYPKNCYFMFQIIHGTLNYFCWSFKCSNLISPDVLSIEPYMIQPDPASLDQQGWLGSLTSLFGLIWAMCGPKYWLFTVSKGLNWSVMMSYIHFQPQSKKIQPVLTTRADWDQQLAIFDITWATFWPLRLPILTCWEQQKVQSGQSRCCQHRSNLNSIRYSQFRPPWMIWNKK